MDQNSLTIVLIAVFAVMIFFMFRNSRKRRKEQEEMQHKLLPGAEVMTSQGIFGVLVSLDEEKNEAIIETTPGTRIRLHRQTLTRVVEPAAEAAEPVEMGLDAEPKPRAVRGDSTASRAEATEPEFGERAEAPVEPVSEAKPARAPRKRPAAE